MAEDKHTRDYMECIKKHKNFQPDGELDETGFYNQRDGSFFDAGGYYFNKQGYDEFGGYYDDNGQYHEEDMDKYGCTGGDPGYIDQEMDQLVQNQFIESAGPNTIFEASMKNLPYSARQEEIEVELKKKGIKVNKISLQHDAANRLVQVDLLIEGKESGQAFFALTNQNFLGRKPTIDFSLQEDFPSVSLYPYLRNLSHNTNLPNHKKK
jgi:hypothetical protein